MPEHPLCLFPSLSKKAQSARCSSQMLQGFFQVQQLYLASKFREAQHGHLSQFLDALSQAFPRAEFRVSDNLRYRRHWFQDCVVSSLDGREFGQNLGLNLSLLGALTLGGAMFGYLMMDRTFREKGGFTLLFCILFWVFATYLFSSASVPQRRDDCHFLMLNPLVKAYERELGYPQSAKDFLSKLHELLTILEVNFSSPGLENSADFQAFSRGENNFNWIILNPEEESLLRFLLRYQKTHKQLPFAPRNFLMPTDSALLQPSFRP